MLIGLRKTLDCMWRICDLHYYSRAGLLSRDREVDSHFSCFFLHEVGSALHWTDLACMSLRKGRSSWGGEGPRSEKSNYTFSQSDSRNPASLFERARYVPPSRAYHAVVSNC